jgi:DNA-binding LacI/PurR family transcriptional regulator
MVGDALRQRILREGLTAGSRLPGYWDLARELDVAYVTVKRGVDALVENGVVTRINGKGLFVGKRAVRRCEALHSVLVAFPYSMHHVLSYAYATDMSRGTLAALNSAGIHHHVRSMVADGLFFGDYVDDLNADAVIMMGVQNDDYLRMALNWGRTIVTLDYCSTAVPMDFVACDNRGAARHCVERLARLGHRRFAYIGGKGVSEIRMRGRAEERMVMRASDAPERRAGVLEAAAACGLPEPRLIQEPVDGTSWEASLKQAFDSGAEQPTAVLLENDIDAPTAIRCLAERGLRVPEDVSVSAVAGAGEVEECPELAYCRFDFRAMGRKGVEVLRERFADRSEPVNRIHRIGFEWVEGGSTREARA